MASDSGHVVLRHREIPDLHNLDVYRQHGGYEQFRRAITTLAPEEIIEQVKASGLRGRGGAGFPTGLKWSFVPDAAEQKYVIVNNDESEPGTFKDHEITLRNPHQFIEGAAIAAYAVGANNIYIYCRGEFWQEMKSLESSIAAVREAELIGEDLFGTDYRLDIQVSPGAGAYICGEETALLNSMEGQLGQPRLKPPFPALEGLYGLPTVVNNTETLANVPLILEKGAEWYRSLGTVKSTGTKVFCLSGHVERPGNYEAPLGTRFSELLEAAGGVWKGNNLKSVLPAGASSRAIPADIVHDLAMDWESVAEVGAQLGSASLIVLDDTTDMVWVAEKTTRFFEHESCGKCSPCREGTYWLTKLYGRVQRGEASADEVSLIEDVVSQIKGKCFCPLGEFAMEAPESTLQHFRSEYLDRPGTVASTPGLDESGGDA
jgi:NADH-quinone oxidoreductase subunit F